MKSMTIFSYSVFKIIYSGTLLSKPAKMCTRWSGN